MKRLFMLPFIAASAILSSCGNTTNSAAENAKNAIANNYFLQKDTLPFYAPDFRKIKDSDFKPALEEGMKRQLAEVEIIANSHDSATFDNTIIALEKSGQLLHRVNAVFNLLTGANTNPTLQKVQEEEASKLAANQDAIYLNTKLFSRIKSIYDHRASLKLDPESNRLVEYYYQEFVLAGAQLSDIDKIKLKKLNEEQATLSAKFTNQLLAAAKAGALVVSDEKKLAGLSKGELEAAAQDANNNNLKGKWMLPLQNTTQQPALQSLTDRSTRQELFENSWNRAERNDSNDTRKNIARIAQIRAEQAELLGFPNYATWKLQDQMAKTPETVNNFLIKLAPAATAKARMEAKDIQSLINQQKGGFTLQPWDWNFYADQVRKQKYNLDENEIKPYFELNNVLEKGVFYAANQLYGLTFKERKDIPVYQKDVRVFEVFDKDNSPLGLFYCDYFKRDNKSGGAWMDNIVTQSRLLDKKPVIYNVCNFTKPAPGQPALISFDDVTTMFHEFGHALHGFFASQEYPSLSGTSVARDFVEFPSQFNEHWALNPQVLTHYAKNYKTGETIPQALVEKIKKASTFNQGYALTELLAAASLDMQWHEITPSDTLLNVDTFEKSSLEKTGLFLPQVPTRYRSSYFLHIWANGYAAGYYAYLWTEMLDDDTFAWFEKNGGLTRANGQRFRDMILSKGNTEDLNKIFVNFVGHEPDIQPMEKDRGLLIK